MTDMSVLNYAGRQQCQHQLGYTVEDFELVLCHVLEPPLGYDYSSANHQIAVQAGGPLFIAMNEFALTAEVECGTLIYSASVENQSTDPFSDGSQSASISGSTITIEPTFTLGLGVWQVRVDVSASLAGAIAYTYYINVEVIDCSQHMMTITDPGTCPATAEFYTFEFVLQWADFSYLDQPGCVVDKYRISFKDPNGLVSIKTFEYNGIAWTTVSQSADTGAFGELFVYDAPNKKIIINNTHFTDASKLGYYGDYTIDIEGGIGSTYYDSQTLACTF